MNLKIFLLTGLALAPMLPASGQKATQPAHSTSVSREAEKSLTLDKASCAIKRRHEASQSNVPSLSGQSNLPGSDYSDLFGMNKSQLKKRFPPTQFRHNADSTQISWHGTDVSTVLDIIYKNDKVSQLRPITHYGYPPMVHPDTTVNGFTSAPKESPLSHSHLNKTTKNQEIREFKKQLKQF